jgi:hypothetical protein
MLLSNAFLIAFASSKHIVDIHKLLNEVVEYISTRLHVFDKLLKVLIQVLELSGVDGLRQR